MTWRRMYCFVLLSFEIVNEGRSCFDLRHKSGGRKKK
jgi:hypothetical protein